MLQIFEAVIQARMTVRLAVAGAFHTDFMQPAVERLRQALELTPIQTPRIPVISNVDAQPHSDPAVIRDILARQVRPGPPVLPLEICGKYMSMSYTLPLIAVILDTSLLTSQTLKRGSSDLGATRVPCRNELKSDSRGLRLAHPRCCPVYRPAAYAWNGGTFESYAPHP